MIDRQIWDISVNNLYLSVFRGFFVIEAKSTKKKISKTIDAVEAIIINGFGITYSHNFLQKLCEVNIPLIICGKNFHPTGMLLSTSGHYKLTKRQALQISLSLPFKKKLWQQIVKEKVKNQKNLLDSIGINSNRLRYLAGKVKSGDTENIEAQAARFYWKELFGKEFKRDFAQKGVNSFLNYGYSLVRASLSRYIVASGLNPSFGIHHKNEKNPFCLVDDLIEPFRPIVDRKVYYIAKQEKDGKLSVQTKRILREVLTEGKLNYQGKFTEFQVILQEFVYSFIDSLKNKGINLHFPKWN